VQVSAPTKLCARADIMRGAYCCVFGGTVLTSDELSTYDLRNPTAQGKMRHGSDVELVIGDCVTRLYLAGKCAPLCSLSAPSPDLLTLTLPARSPTRAAANEISWGAFCNDHRSLDAALLPALTQKVAQVEAALVAVEGQPVPCTCSGAAHAGQLRGCGPLCGPNSRACSLEFAPFVVVRARMVKGRLTVASADVVEVRSCLVSTATALYAP